MIQMIFIALLTVLLLNCQAPRAQQPPEHLKKMIECDQTARQINHDQMMIKHYISCGPLVDRFAGSHELYILEGQALLQAFETASTIVFYSKTHGGKSLETIFARIPETSRDKAMAQRVFTTHLQCRDFIAAKEFNEKFPQYNLPPPPQVDIQTNGDESQPKVYRIINAQKLRLENFSVVAQPHVYVVFDPACQFCEKFKDYLSKNKHKISRALPAITFIYPQVADISQKQLTQALQSRPHTLIAHKEEAFYDLFPEWDNTPAIYFLKNKQVVYKLEGWSNERPEQFFKYLKKLGIL